MNILGFLTEVQLASTHSGSNFSILDIATYDARAYLIWTLLGI